MLLINDVHIGFDRKAGVTPASKEALRIYLFSSLELLLRDTNERHLVVNGDLFDSFEVESRDWMETFELFSKWLYPGTTHLTLIAGNHDWSQRGLKVSSFEMLGKVLRSAYDGQVDVVGIDEAMHVEDEVWALAHCSNQDVFDLKLDELLHDLRQGEQLLLHANYHNHFAANSDHSLNVSEERARQFIDRGITLVFAHEHQARREMPQGSKQTGAEVIVTGNQWPTSVSDCLGNDEKYAHTWGGERWIKVRTWERGAEFGYQQAHWSSLHEYPLNKNAGFLRVFGQCKSSEAAEALAAIAKFRQASDAFIITNAIEVEGVVSAEALPASFEAAKRVDVLGLLKQEFEPAEWAVIEKLLEN